MIQVPVIDISRFALPAVILLSATSLTLLASNRWRWCLFALGVQYVGVFTLVALNWPLALSAVKLVAGWMAGLVLAIAMHQKPDLADDARFPSDNHPSVRKPDLSVHSPDPSVMEEHTQPGGAVFRVLAAGLVALVVASVAPRMAEWMPGVEMEPVWGGLILIGIGLLDLGLTAQPLRVVLGLLTVLSGFEILYAAVETATLVAGLLAAVTLCLALVGAYLLSDGLYPPSDGLYPPSDGLYPPSPNLEEAG